MKQQLKETSISNDSLEVQNMTEYWQKYAQDKKAENELLRQSNKELIEALEKLVTVHSQLHRNAHTYTEIRNAKAALQKAKQL